jgi:signal transduction histidine kinase
VVLTAVLAAFVLARSLDPAGPVPRALGQAWAVCVVGVAAAFAVGLLRRRLLLADVLEELSRSLREPAGPGPAAATLRRVLGDRGAEVLTREAAEATWRRADGTAADLDALRADGAVVRELGGQGRPALAVVLDPDADAGLADAVAAVTEVALGRTALQAELDASRRNIATVADAERRRIQRDLHDGVQQQLIALRIRLSMADDTLTEDADHILEDIRALAAGIYPPLLEDSGIVPALRAAARGAPVPLQLPAERGQARARRHADPHRVAPGRPGAGLRRRRRRPRLRSGPGRDGPRPAQPAPPRRGAGRHGRRALRGGTRDRRRRPRPAARRQPPRP